MKGADAPICALQMAERSCRGNKLRLCCLLLRHRPIRHLVLGKTMQCSLLRLLSAACTSTRHQASCVIFTPRPGGL